MSPLTARPRLRTLLVGPIMTIFTIGFGGSQLTMGAIPIPAAPSHLVATAMAPDRIDLSWGDPSGSTFTFVVERSMDGSTNWNAIASASPGVTSCDDAGLKPYTTYYYRAKSRSTDNVEGPYSNIAFASTPQVIPDMPLGFSASGSSASRIDLSWTGTNIPGVTYAIERSLDGVSGWSVVGSGLGGTAYGDTGLSASTTYFYRLRAATSSGPGPYSSVVACTTLAASGIILDGFGQPAIRKAATGEALWTPYHTFGSGATIQGGVCALENGPYSTGTSTGGNTSTTLVDTNGVPSLDFGPTGTGFVQITSGTGAGQIRRAISTTATAITVSSPWTVIPDATSKYSTYYPVAGGLYFLPDGTRGNYSYPTGYLQGHLESGTFDPDVDRFAFRIKSSFTYVHPTPYNTIQVGTYVKQHADPSWSYQGSHYYHYCGGNWYANQWGLLILNRKPSHRVTMVDLDWPADPEYQQGYFAVANRISNSTATNGSATVTTTYPSEATASPSYFSAGTRIVARSRSQGYYTPGAFPDGTHPVYTIASVAGDGSTFTLDRPFEGATGSWSWDNTNKLPSTMSDGTTPGVPVHYYDGWTNFYIRFDTPKPWAVPGTIGAWDAPYYYYDDIEFWKSNGHEPDNILYNIWCIYTGTGYEVQWNGPKYTTETYTVYYGSLPLANTDGTYNGQGTSGGAVGPSSGVLLWSSPAMAEQNAIYFFIKPASSPTGTHFKMTRKS